MCGLRLRLIGIPQLLECAAQQIPDVEFLFVIRGGTCCLVLDGVIRVQAVVLLDLLVQHFQNGLRLDGVAFPEEAHDLARTVGTDETLLGAKGRHQPGKVPQDMVAHRVTILPREMVQAGKLEAHAGKVAGQQALLFQPCHHGIHTVAVGQTGLFVHIHKVFHKVAGTAHHNGQCAAHEEEEYKADGQIQLGVDAGPHSGGAGGLQIVRAQGAVVLHAGLVHDLVVVHQRLLVLVDLRLDRGMGGLIAAHPAGCLEGVQQLLGVGPADGAAAQGLVDLHILQNQRIVGDLLALVVIVGLYVLQNVVGAAVVGVVVVMVVDQVAVLLRVVLDQAAEVDFPLLIHLLVLHAALDALGQVAAQLVGVAHLRPGHHIRVQRRDLVVVQHLIDVVQVLVGITRDRRAEVGIVCLFILQIVQHFGGVGRQHVHALVIVVAAVQ